MKILWIEDFGANSDDLSLSEEVFGNLISVEDFDEDEEIPPQLVNAIKSNTLHELYWCKSYMDWKNTYRRHAGDFDVAIIDFNLEKHKTQLKDIPRNLQLNEKFDKQAGFYIYHQLIKSGFPEDNIAFFTAEAGNVRAFHQWCGRILLDPPMHTFEKSINFYKKIRSWLDERIQNEYMTLRRGIIMGCELLMSELKKTPDKELESRLLYYRTTTAPVAEEPELHRLEMKEYFEHVKEFIPLVEQVQENKMYPLFIKELVRYWERSQWSFIRVKGLPLSQTGWKQEDSFYEISQAILKLVRNWSAHDLMTMQPRYCDVAYIFMLTVRAKLQLDYTTVYPHEQLLAKLFNKHQEIEEQGVFYTTLKQFLYESYMKIDNEYKGAKFIANMNNQFFQRVEACGKISDEFKENGLYKETLRNKIKDSAMRLLYQTFWHGLFPLYYGRTSSIDFNTDEKLKPGTFPHFLAELTFAEAFSVVLNDVKPVGLNIN